MFGKSLFLILLLGAMACTPKEKTVEITVPSLPVYQIYDLDTVAPFLEAISEEGIKLGRAYLAKAKNNRKKNPDKAIYYYKRSLSIHPKYEVYMEFKEVLEETKNYKELDKLFMMLFSFRMDNPKLYPFKKPDFETFIDYVVNQTRIHDPYFISLSWQMDHLGIAKKKVREALHKDERIPFEKESKAFRVLEMNFLEDEEYQAYIKSPEYLEFFIQSFEKVSDTWLITDKTVADFAYNGEFYNSGEGNVYEPDFSSLLPCNSDSAYSYNMGCRLLLNTDHIAIIYSMDESEMACPKEMRHITHYLAFYSSEYELLKCVPIAWQNEKELVTAEVKGWNVVQKVYSRTWEKAYDKKDFDNHLVSNEFVEERRLYFDDKTIHLEDEVMEEDEAALP